MFYRKHKRVTTPVGDRSRTKQSHKDECDIHNILKQYQRTGIVTHVQTARGTYEDLPDGLDYQLAMNTILEADQAFGGLPAAVRDHFANDPERFLAAIGDESQHDKLREFGVLGKRPEEGPVRPPAPSGAQPPSPAPKPPETPS